MGLTSWLTPGFEGTPIAPWDGMMVNVYNFDLHPSLTDNSKNNRKRWNVSISLCDQTGRAEKDEHILWDLQ